MSSLLLPYRTWQLHLPFSLRFTIIFDVNISGPLILFKPVHPLFLKDKHETLLRSPCQPVVFQKASRCNDNLWGIRNSLQLSPKVSYSEHQVEKVIVFAIQSPSMVNSDMGRSSLDVFGMDPGEILSNS